MMAKQIHGLENQTKTLIVRRELEQLEEFSWVIVYVFIICVPLPLFVAGYRAALLRAPYSSTSTLSLN